MKKLTALFLTLSLTLCTFITSYAEYGALSVDDIYEHGQAESDGEIYYEIGKNNIDSDVKFFMDLGLVEVYYPNESIKRAVLKEFIKLSSGGDAFYNKYFTDSDSEKKTLSFKEALIAMMDLTGYAYFVKGNGGNEADYYRIASRYGFLDGVDINAAKKKLTAEQFLKMAYNTLNVSLVSFNGSSYKIEKGSTLLNSFLKLTEVKGVVKANSYTALNGLGGVGDDKIRIEQTDYEVKNIKDIDEYLGFYVIAYADKDNKIVSLSVDKTRNKMMDFDNSSDLAESSSKQSFVYYDDKDKKKSLSIDRYADLIYNYAPVTSYSSDFYQIENGTIKLIDNDGDGSYDVVLKKEYTSFKPLSKSEYEYTITDRLGNVYDTQELLKEDKYHGIRDINGNPLTYDDIKMSGNISVLTKKDSNVVTEIIVYDDIKYEGDYSNYSADKEELKIGEKTFKMSKIYSLLNNNKFPFELGSNVLVYLDPLGRIIDAETSSVQYKYAWIIGMKKEGFGDVKIKMFTQDDKMVICGTADRINLNGTKIDAEQLLSKTEIYKNDKVREQLIKYRLNKDGYLADIRTADESNMGVGVHKRVGDSTFQKNLNHYDYYIENGNTGGGIYSLYNTGGTTFASKYLFSNTDTYLFSIPNQYYRDKYGDECFSVQRSLPSSRGRYTFNLYDVDSNMVVGAGVKESGGIKNDYIYDPMGSAIVREVSSIYDKSAEQVVTNVFVENITGTYTTNWTQYPLDDMGTNVFNDSWNSDVKSFKKYTKANYNLDVKAWEDVKTMADLKPGMIVKPGSKTNNYVTAFRTYFVYDETKDFDDQMYEYASEFDATMYDEVTNLLKPRGTYSTGSNYYGVTEDRFYGKYLCAFGKVVEKTKNGMIFNAKKGAPAEWNRLITTTSDRGVTFVDVNRNKISKGTFAEVQAGDYLFVDMSENTLYGIAVYRK
ncbi:MAG: hypothetical protein EGR16_09955 [Clostridiales bacterium]|nr:hypothetical protein [Clostridiales bacterium]